MLKKASHDFHFCCRSGDLCNDPGGLDRLGQEVLAKGGEGREFKSQPSIRNALNSAFGQPVSATFAACD